MFLLNFVEIESDFPGVLQLGISVISHDFEIN